MKKFLKILGIILGVGVVLVIIAALVAFLLGYVYGGIKQPTQVATLKTAVCSKADIDKYNALVVTFPTNQEQLTKKAADFKAFSETIVAKDSYEKDPSCVFMVYASAVQNTNQEDAKKYYDTLVTLSEAGEYPKNTILDLVSLPSMKDRVEGLGNTEEDTPNPMGSG